MIGIIGAMQVEIDTILKEVSNLKEHKQKIRTFYTGTISNKDVVITLAGIGKVNAAVTTSLLIEHYNVDTIINIGVAGGQKGVKHMDVVVSSEVLYHDVDVTKYSDYVHGQMPGETPTFIADKSLINATKKVLDTFDFDYKIGRIASGDQFVLSIDSIKEVNKLYNDIYAIEMEACAIGHVSSQYGVPFIVYRSISDVLGDESQSEDFYTFVEKASVNASKVLSKLIEVL